MTQAFLAAFKALRRHAPADLGSLRFVRAVKSTESSLLREASLSLRAVGQCGADETGSISAVA